MGVKHGGRKKGTPNKSTLPLKELAEKLDVDPFEVLLRFAAEDWKGLGYEARTETKFTPQGLEVVEYVIAPQMRLKAAAEACQYLHPKRKAVEQTVDPATLDALRKLENASEQELLAIVNGQHLI